MSTKWDAARWRVGFWTVALLFAWLAGMPATAVASPGCQILNGQSGTLGPYGFIEFLNNSQPVNQGDAVTLTSSGTVEYVGSFLQMSDSGVTVSGTEGGSGASGDGLENLGTGSVTYSVTCASVGATVSGVSPSSDAYGSTVFITGSGFYGTSTVMFGSTPATSFTVDSGTTITATVPNGSGTVAISVITDAGTASGGSFRFAAPTAGAASATVAFDGGSTAIALNVTGNPTSVAVVGAPSHGLAVANGTSITYKPTAGYAGPDSFTYTASNAAGTSSPATVSVTVSAPTLALSPSTLPGAVAESSYSQTLSASGGTTPYTYALASGALPSGLSLNAATGSLSGIPLSAGSFNFTVRATDSSTGPAAPFSTTQTYTLTVNAPVITVTPASLPSAQQGTAYSQPLSASGGAGSYAFSASGNVPAGLVLNSTGVLSGTPTANGSFNFTVVAKDGDGFTSSQAYTLVVGAPNAPTASTKSVTTTYDMPTSIDLSASIAGVDITAVTVATQPAHGTVSVSGETVTYTPSSTFYGGTDSFTYTATNPGGASTPATVTITVGAPAAPTVTNASASTAYDTAASINLASAVSGVDITAVTVATQPAHGMVSVSGEAVTYTPAPTFYGGTDSFTYTATNPGGTSSLATVTIVVGAPAAPTVATESASTAYNTAAAINLAGAISGADITAVAVASQPAHGTASVSGETVTYTPSSTFYGGTDSFTYTATNPGGTSSSATVTVTVGAPAVPMVAAKSVTTPYNTAASIDLSGSATGVDITAVTVGTAPAHGTVSVSGETVTYTPLSPFYGGTDSFTYTATNPGGTSSPATVTVTVTPLSVPTAQAISVSTTTGTPVLIEATSGATGPEPPTAVSVASAPAHGSANASGGQITYVPAAGFVGSDSFSYRVANHFGSSAPATITVTVTAAGSLGAASGTKTVTTTPGTAVTVNLGQIVPDTYVSSALTGLSPGNAGQAMLNQPATLTFTPNPAFRGLAQLSAVLVAASGRQVTIDVLVLVSSQPDPSKNPDVLGLVNAQTEQAQRFAQSQLDNIDGRLESLHDGGSAALFSNTLAISLDGRALQAPRQGDPGKRGQVDRDENPFGAVARPGMGAAGGEFSGTAQSESSVGTLAKPSTTTGSEPAGLGLWIAGAANFGSFEAYRQASGFDSDNIAVNVGVDQRINPHALIGFSLGYNHDNADIASNGTRTIANGYSAALYGSYQPSAQTYVDLVLGGGGLGFGSRRYDADTGILLSGRRNGSQWFGSLTAGYEYHNQAGLLLSPYLRLEQSLSELNGFSEQGAATAALTYGNQTVRTSLAVLGLRASEQLRLDWGTLVPRARLEIGHDFQGTSDTTLSYALIPSAGSWNVLTNPYAANGTSVQLGLGLDLQLPRELRLTTDYEYLVQPHAHDQMIRFGLNKQF